MHEELEAAIRADPEDHAAWTVYGDWLLEHGDRRGQLVRGGRPPVAHELEQWRGPIPEVFIRELRNGFAIELEVPLTVRAAEQLAPILADRASRLVSSLAIRPYDYRVDTDLEADPQSDLPIDPLRTILANDLRRLRALAIRFFEFTDEQIDLLSRTPLAIAELDVRYTNLTDAHLARLATAPWFAGLSELHLQHTKLTDASVGVLSRPLAFLDVRDTGIPLDAVDAKHLLPARRTSSLVGERGEPGVPRKLAEGLTLSPQPTARFTSPRLIERASMSRSFTTHCERVPPSFVRVYVDPDEWTFRTYENILPLDRLFPSTPRVELREHCELAHEVHRFTVRGELPAFDDLPLYAKPMNAGTRGGKRYIFHAQPLADALTASIKRALPQLKGFSHVNPVFRCNRFEPGDEPFRRHLDTPYADAARQQLSQYTVLIYLTGGTAAPALEIEGLKIDAIEALQCFVFHQAYEHAGQAYTDGRKVFLRTELVFEHADVAHDPRIAALFSKACYLTGESTRDAELARDADRAYNAVAAAHWRGVLPPPAEPFVHKQFRGIHWLANGYDFWFPKSLPLPDCAAITLLDYFNCTLDGVAFRTLAQAEVMRDVDPESFAFPAPQPLPALDLDMAMPPSEREGSCCPAHASLSWIASRAPDVIEIYDRAKQFCRARIEQAPITMLGQDVFLEPSRFQISGNQIHVLSTERLAPVNFAACWNCHGSPPNFVGVDRTVSVLQPLVPPILWEATRATHHLMFDFFRNGWMVSHRQYDVALPVIRNVHFESVDETESPWFDANRNAAPNRELPPVQRPFWGYYDDSPLLRELYADRPDKRR